MPPVSKPRPKPAPIAPAAAVPKKAAAGPLVSKEARITIELPMVRLTGSPYCAQRIDLRLSGTEAQSLRDVYDGLTANGEFSHKSATPQDAIRWLLCRASENFKA